ncbi:MAG: hypothetical protein K9L79_18360 [Methylobacter tundripaludum]|nr:hypothetical protein [Methylobacter tundripaludum]
MNSINNFLLMATVLASFVITSCASYKPVRYDSQLPTSELPPCFNVPKKTLAEGASCIALVEADNKESRTGLNVKLGEKYLVSAPGRQAWFDLNRRNTPLCGENGSLLMKLFSFKKRSANALWFSVLAEVIPSKDPKSAPQDLCANKAVFEANADGELVLYPNDAEGFFWDKDYFYSNNYGKIWVEIQHQKIN